jgi:hypothetical protein
LNLDHLDEFYSSLGPNELKETEPCVGLLCVARFVEDQRFYRSQIIDIKGDVAQVLFVDYGNEQDDTPLQDLKRIVPDFLTFPKLVMLPSSVIHCNDFLFVQTIPCHIKDVKRVEPPKSDYHNMKLRALYLEETSRRFFTRPNQAWFGVITSNDSCSNIVVF